MLYDAEGELVKAVDVESSIIHIDTAGATSLKLTGVAAVFECVEQ